MHVLRMCGVGRCVCVCGGAHQVNKKQRNMDVSVIIFSLNVLGLL